MDYFPLFMDLRNQPVLVVGAGPVALRKTRSLLAAQARVTLVAPECDADFEPWLRQGNPLHLRARFEPAHLQGMRLAVAATGDENVNRAVFEAGEAAGVPVNAVDQPSACRFIMPAWVERSPLLIAISTAGHVPVLARRIRAQLERDLPHRLGPLAQLGARSRDRVREALPDAVHRRRFWDAFFEGSIAQQYLSGLPVDVERDLDERLARWRVPDGAQAGGAARGAGDAPHARGDGSVFLVGAGPGDPELLTLRALRLMQQADVVLHDNLVSAAILDCVRRDARRIYVGKVSDNHTLPQEDINTLMVRLAREGLDVLRLKGGDPFVFGRGGEEIETLARQGVRFQVVPGITSASGASCLAGIPLTHRDHAQAVTFVTGHRRANETELNWTRNTHDAETVVVYMGLLQAAAIAARLIGHGRSPQTPVAVVQDATLPTQRVFIADLATLGDVVQREQVRSPALLIIGSVVLLYEKLRQPA